MNVQFAVCAALLAGGAGRSLAAENGLGQKPYLGWSSWSLQATKFPGYGGQSWLNAEHVRQQSDAMEAKLQKHGYTYINMDSGWRGGWDEFGRPAPDAKKFPGGIRAVADYVHAKGQKLGIYYVPGIDDDVLQQNPVIKGTRVRLQDIVFNPQRVANAWGGGHAIDYSRPGAREYIQSIADLFAEWQIDFLKFDGVTPGSQVEDPKVDARADAEAWGAALLKTKRPIWYTLSWKIDMRHHEFWKRYANALRVTQDVESYDDKLTHWAPQIQRHFQAAHEFSWAAGKGRGWNDLDSLLIGNGEMSGLTPAERRSVATLWAIACSPMYSGDDLTKLDALGLELLTNDEVIAVQQSGNVARLLDGGAGSKGSGQIWAARNEDGALTVAMFNHANQAQSITATWQVLGLRGAARVRDLWARRDIGAANRDLTVSLEPHACRLLEITPMAGPR